MARIDDAQNRLRLLLNPEEAPLPADDEIANLLEQSAVRLENTTTRARQIDRTIKRLELADRALTTEKEKRGQIPGKATRVHELKTGIAAKLEDDDSATPVAAPAAPATPPAPPAGTP